MYGSAHPDRGRMEDHYPDGLERDHEPLGSPRREGRGRYTDRDREDYKSPPRDRSRSRSPYYGASPNRNVILEGLPLEMTQEDVGGPISTPLWSFTALQNPVLSILNELQHNLRVEGLEEIRLIKDKRTGQSRQFAFAQFVGIPEARRFLERYYPYVSLYGAYKPSRSEDTEATKVRIAFSRDKDDRDKPGKSEEDWKCEVLILAGATANGVVVSQSNMSAFSGFATTGDSDTSPDDIASQFLLLRGLEPGVNEELLAKGVCKLYTTKPSASAADKQPAKKAKITSTGTDASLGAKEGSLQRVLLVRDRKSDDSWRYGFAEFATVEDAQAAMAKYKAADKFTISSKPVMISYIHAGVFVPVLHQFGPELAKFTFSPLSNPAVKLMYWDEAAYVAELVTAVASENITIKSKENEHAKLAAAAANEGLVAPGKDGEPRAKKRKVEKDGLTSNKKVVAPHLQFWTNRHAEIHGLSPKEEGDNIGESATSITKNKVEAALDPPSQTFADLDRKCCLLCSRQFKTEVEVNKHERMSQLHRDNMKNDDLVAKALAKLSKSTGSGTDSAAYRDRAKERRYAFNQPKQPAAQHHRPPKDAGTVSAVDQEVEAAPVQSKGAALLGKMGWTAGKGLGAQGTGMTSAITTELYTQGVGLGAQGGKVGDAIEEAQRQTKSTYADFLSKTRDKAKERFESME
ncbi:putative RNA-binding [Hyphodiscus hymeniophilus]|uniref:RNA-binding n=1 Tax=Hyphodiscus hymeniophilus TaxID=353542 RepID=A0A9P7AYZ2_9HELO|nr:putative RNA-binding [Hyphodiscus hymeniophilus]